MVVQGHVAQQRLLQVLAAAEPVGFENIGNAAVEALDHSVGSGRSRLGQPVFNPQRLAKLVKLMAATGLALSGCKEPVRELLAVVGQQLVDFDRAGLVQSFEEGFCTGGRLVGLDGHKHPACGPVNGDKQVAPLGLVLHLGQILHVHVQVARLVALERFVGLLGRGRLQCIQIAYTVAAQAPIQSRTRDIRAEKFTRDGEQIIEWQQQRAAQVHDHCLLGGGELGLQAVRSVGTIGEDLSLLPFVNRLLGNTETLGQDTSGLNAGSDLGAHGGRSAGVFVQGNHHGLALPVVSCRDSINSCKTARAMKSG